MPGLQKVTTHLTLAGDIILHDASEDAPLVHLKFTNEAKDLSAEDKLEIGKVVRDMVVSRVGEDVDRFLVRVETLKKVAKLGRDIIHDYLTHEEQEGIADDLKEIDAAIKSEPNPQADQSCQLDS